MKAKIQLYSYEDGVTEYKTVEGIDMDDIRTAAENAVEEWMKDGEWGNDGANVSAKWSIMELTEIDEDEDLGGALYGNVEVDIEPNHLSKIKDAVGNADICGNDHDWTSDGEGGLTENPGVYGHGGTRMSFDSHCRKCGLHRHELSVGSQRNPDDHDTVEYRMLDDAEIDAHRANGDMDSE